MLEVFADVLFNKKHGGIFFHLVVQLGEIVVHLGYQGLMQLPIRMKLFQVADERGRAFCV